MREFLYQGENFFYQGENFLIKGRINLILNLTKLFSNQNKNFMIPPNYIYVQAGLYIHADKRDSSVQAFYTQGLNTCQGFAMWNADGFFLAHVLGKTKNEFPQIISHLKQLFSDYYFDAQAFGHIYANENDIQTIAFKKALAQQKIVVTSLQSTKCIVTRKELLPLKQNWKPGYFQIGQISPQLVIANGPNFTLKKK